MKIILILIKKEIRQLRRNKAMLSIIFVLPLIQLLILANAATFEIKNLKIAILDQDKSSSSRLLISKYNSSEYFNNDFIPKSALEAEELIHTRKVDLYLHIPQNFEKNLVREGQEKIMLAINAIDGSKAALAQNYSQAIINDFGSELKKQYLNKVQLTVNQPMRQVQFIQTIWYNKYLNYKIFMVPGILVLLITMVGAFLSSMNIVREKEIGTIEQINVTPIKKHEFIIGKLVPFWVLGLFQLAFGLFLAFIIFHVPVEGSLWIIFSFASIYMLAILGLGLLISTISDTQQQAMFLTWFFLVVFILLSGLFTPIENMPEWTQKLTYFNPIRYFIEVIRMVMLKGSGFQDVKNHYFVVIIFAVILNFVAVLRYRKTV